MYALLSPTRPRSTRMRRRRLLSILVPLVLVLATGLNAGVASGRHASGTAQAATVAPIEEVAYYGNWDIYGSHYYLKNVASSGAAAKLTTLMYGFENIDPVNLTCFQTVKSAGTLESDPNAGDGAGDAWADYQKPFDAKTSVNGSADVWNQPLKGNFNQIKQLKTRFPNLKVLVSMGGWTFSKYFSAAAATPQSRSKLVSSCLDMYIRGTLPTGIAGDTSSGGPNVAANVFDGIDIDWEFPAAEGHLGNLQSPADTANYTALLAEFRAQLDVAGSAAGKHYLLTAALPSGPNNIKLLQVPQISQLLDFADLMSYDMHGSWESSGPANFQAPLYSSAMDPAGSAGLSVDVSVNSWLAAGMPPSKLVLGIPAYWRGWAGVPDGGNHGLYGTATGPSAPFPTTVSVGVANYRELLAAGLTAQTFSDPLSKSPWIYSNGSFYTGDTPQSAAKKAAYARQRGLRGGMLFSIDGDDSRGSLLTGIDNGVHLRRVPVIALGDSYSSGEGSPPFDAGTDTGVDNCHRSYNAWPRILSRISASGAHLVGHIACAGALIPALTSSFNTEPPQLQQLQALPRPSVITVSLGGNDIGFSSVLTKCYVINCDADIAQADFTVTRPGGLVPALTDAVHSIVLAVPTARVVVVGYPNIFPITQASASNCGWLTDTERPALVHLASDLDTASRAAATAAGADFVSTLSSLQGHEECTQSSWMVPIGLFTGAAIQQNGHPNSLGQLAMEQAVQSQLGLYALTY